MSNNCNEVSTLQAFEVVVDFARQVENRAWNALYNFLTGNSILVLAWATLYREKADSLDCLLIALPAIGFLLSLGWATFGARNFAYNQMYATKIRTIQKDGTWLKCKLLPQAREEMDATIHDRGLKLPLGYQSMLLAGTPLWFSVIYVVMGWIVLAKLQAHASWLLVLFVAAVAVIWAILACIYTAHPEYRLSKLIARCRGRSVPA